MTDPTLPSTPDAADSAIVTLDLSAIDLDQTGSTGGAIPPLLPYGGGAEREALYRQRAIELCLDFQWKSIVQTVDVINKSIGFYFLLLVGVTGAIYQAKVSGAELLIAIVTISLITVAVATACGFLAWGVVSGLTDVQRTLESFHSSVFAERALETYFGRARIAARAAMVCSLCIALIIIGALMALSRR